MFAVATIVSKNGDTNITLVDMLCIYSIPKLGIELQFVKVQLSIPAAN